MSIYIVQRMDGKWECEGHELLAAYPYRELAEAYMEKCKAEYEIYQNYLLAFQEAEEQFMRERYAKTDGIQETEAERDARWKREWDEDEAFEAKWWEENCPAEHRQKAKDVSVFSMFMVTEVPWCRI